MREVGVFEAKTHLSALLEEVAAGESVLLTKRGRPVARLVPAEESDRETKERAIKEIRALRGRIGWATIDEILEMRDEGRRW